MRRLPAEWEPQRFVQLTWPHAATDWAPMLDEVNACFVELALSVIRFEPLLVVCANAPEVTRLLNDEIERRKGKIQRSEKAVVSWKVKGSVEPGDDTDGKEDPFDGLISLVELPSNDTWARDHGGITVYDNGQRVIYDYAFNGWGQKFEAGLDNELTAKLYAAGVLQEAGTAGKTGVLQETAGDTGLMKEAGTEGDTGLMKEAGTAGDTGLKQEAGTAGDTGLKQEIATAGVTGYRDCLDFVLEGGSLESDGHGTLLTTSECLLSEFRNPSYTKEMIEQRLKEDFGLVRVLWLNHGYLEGDDTDSHIDTLARFCDRDTIAYVRCDDPVDAHFDALQKMEQELRQFRTFAGQPYRLIPLPMADAAYDDEGNRLPATYANFLIINGAVLVPTYGNPLKDELALNQLRIAFPDREIVGVDCRILIEQHGSLHCVTMQY